MIMLLTMEIFRVASLLLFFCFYSAFCFPSRPLNERSTELAWQAWLLVDDQNQNKHYDSDNVPRRRITPKSVFIAPTFSPESLPACAEGYRPDPMGRCIKIIKLDEEAHLDFLLEKLNAQFGNYDEVEEEGQEDRPTPGPFQLNIPLGGQSEEQTKDDSSSTGNLDIAIVVAPTNGNFGLDDGDNKASGNVKRTQQSGNSDMGSKPTPATSTLQEFQQVNNNNLKRKTDTNRGPPVQIATTTTQISTEETTTVLPTEYEGTTSVLDLIEESTLISSTPYVPPTVETESTTLEDGGETTVSNQHALFFLKPSSIINTGHVRNGTNNAEDTPVAVSGDDSVVISDDSLTTLLSNSTFVVNASIDLNNKQHLPYAYQEDHHAQFKDPPLSMDNGDLMPSENVHSAGYVRFPTDDEAMPSRINQNQFLPSLNTYASRFQHGPQQDMPNAFQKVPLPDRFGGLFDDYVHRRGADLKGNERFVFKSHSPSPETTFPGNLGSDPENGRHQTHINHRDRTHSPSNNDRFEVPSNNNRVVFNHRNRDKQTSLWSVPSSWSESSPQKPIVLRFSRRSGNSRQLLEEHLKPHTQNSPTFYREVPTEDFSYIFGINEDTNHDRKRTHR